MSEAWLEYRPLSEIEGADRNPRQHDIGAIHQSITRFGFINPLIVNDDTGKLVAGHGRLIALRQKAEMGENPPARIKVINGEWHVPILRGTRFQNEREAEAYLIGDNKITELASWDDAALSELLKELADETGTLEGTGYDGDDLDELLESLGYETEKPEAPEAQIDRAEELREKWQTERGQLWQIGRHRLLCGDSTDAEDVVRLMGGEKADMVFTDPPYGYEYQSNMRTKTKKFDVLVNDDAILDGFIPLLEDFSRGWVLICSSWKVISEWIAATRPLGEMQNLIVWDKGGGGMGDLTHSLSTDYELIFAFNRGETVKGKRIGSVWSIGKDNASSYNHATQKPVELAALALETFSLSNQSVLDLFIGGGSTMAAAEQVGRTCYGMELEPKYVAVTLERLSQMGLEPTLTE